MNIRKILLLAVTFIIPTLILAQTPLNHPKKIYQSPEGRLYIQKDLPIYLRLSTSPEAEAESFLLQSEDSKAYTNPMFLDTEGFNTFRSPSKVDTITHKPIYPIQDIIFEIYADSEAPKTKVTYGGNKPYKKDTVLYFGEKLKLSLESNDATSGVEDIYYSINKSAYKKYTTELDLNEETAYTVKFYAVDYVGNAEVPKTVHLMIDISKPVTKLEIDPDKYNDIISIRSKLSLNATDNSSQIAKTYYTIDEGTQRVYYQPISLAKYREGEHSISYYSVDKVGNKEDTVTYQFYLDKTAPIIVDELLGNTFIANGKEYSSGRSRIKLTAMDNKAGVKEIRYSINDGEFITYTKPFTLSKSGKLIVKTFAIDNVNNQKINTILAGRSNISYVDLSGPRLSNRYTGPHFISKDTMYITNKTKISLYGRDDEAGFKIIQYQVDNNTSQGYSTPFTIDSEGLHKISYTGFDNVDNTNTKEFSCFVDTTGPELYHRFSIISDKKKTIEGKEVDVYPSHTVLFLSATDINVGYDKMTYRINNGSPKLYSSLISQFVKNKYYSLEILASDKLGNKNTKSIEFFIE